MDKTNKVKGRSIRKNILFEIQKDKPGFTESDYISLDELNKYRQRYIENKLEEEIGSLTQLEKEVIKSIAGKDLLSDNLSDSMDQKFTYGQRLADKIASFGGSWKFIIFFGAFIFSWMVLNIVFLLNKGFDPYPFILLNLILSCLAAIQAPVIMMSQNRQEEKDRERARNDYQVNLKSEIEIRMLHEKLDHLMQIQQERSFEIQEIQTDMLKDIMNEVSSLKKRIQ